MSRRVVLSIVAAVTLLHCEPFQPLPYAPKQTQQVALNGEPAAFFAIPTEHPRGHLLVAMPTLTYAGPHGLDDESERAIYVQYLVANRSDEEWSVDRGEQRVDLSTRNESISLRAVPPGLSDPPKIRIAPHTTELIGFYFELPIPYEYKEVPTFDIVWEVQTGAGPQKGRSSFQRSPGGVPMPSGIKHVETRG